MLTRLPVITTNIHARPGRLNKPLLEVVVKDENGEPLSAFVTHLTAAFNQGRAGGHIRMREARAILEIMEPLRKEGQPHFLMGDFNSLAPGDVFKGSHLLRNVVELDKEIPDLDMSDGIPQMASIVPPKLSFLKPILRAIPRSELLSNLFDAVGSLYAPRGCIRLLYEAGYIDCFRHLHPGEWGFTCPAAAPAGRIDYIFASPDLVERLELCHEIAMGENMPGSYASDHLAVTALFGVGAKLVAPAEEPEEEAVAV
jgi:hypothetical protein